MNSWPSRRRKHELLEHLSDSQTRSPPDRALMEDRWAGSSENWMTTYGPGLLQTVQPDEQVRTSPKRVSVFPPESSTRTHTHRHLDDTGRS